MLNFSTFAITLLSAALLGGGVLHSCSSGKQQRVISGQERQIAELTAERTALARSLHLFETARGVESAVLEAAHNERERAAAQARHTERQLQEAMRRETAVNFSTVLSHDVSDAFCLRYFAAAGAGGSAAASAAGHAAGEDNPPAAQRAGQLAPDCSAWQGLTLADVLSWTGALLDHAGEERRDKAAVREWSRRMRLEYAR